MVVSFFIKDKKANIMSKKKRINWNQSLTFKPQGETQNKIEFKKSIYFILLLKKYNNIIDFKNIRLLKGFLTKSGKIRPRRKTRVHPIQQRRIAKAIKKARCLGLMPYTCDVKI
jgi:small subunit ribosomal protein S18